MSVRVQAAMLFFVCLHLQANEAFLAPIGPPRIFDVPVTVLCALGFLVSCERHRMIHLELALTSMGGVAVDPAHVECPARGVHRHNYRRASLDKRLPQWLELVRGQERVAGNSEPDLGEDCVVAGHLGSAAGFVAPHMSNASSAVAPSQPPLPPQCRGFGVHDTTAWDDNVGGWLAACTASLSAFITLGLASMWPSSTEVVASAQQEPQLPWSRTKGPSTDTFLMTFMKGGSIFPLG
eukprot:CAMPEP_0168493044 /NCGR_PEP_ID=MMETSP0228-20121227/70524_1 /TAXON_ID=133427 /ORGANISM="Protoceratium reticulatum, Strain CCCM 535 (=CCMP 1889)" /LENGTH=236 /DNA_ID=CAMNT_0008509831 /DNA_START=257 /DNA_END=963 /DNA_ORIENTATION=+